MKERFTAFLILTAMLASLAACGDNGSAQIDTTAGDTTIEAAIETSEFTPTNDNFGGVDFIIAENDIGDWMQSAFVTEENGDVLNDSIFKRNRTVEELYNVSIKGYKIEGARNGAELSTLKNSILAGDKEFDIAYIPGQQTSKTFADPNMLVGLNTISTLDLTHSWWDASSVEAMTFAGKTISLTGDMIVTTTGSTTLTLFNKQIAEDFKFDIYGMVRDGSFTLEKVYDMAKQVSQDLDGDTKMDANFDRFGLCVESLNLMHVINSSGEKLVTRDSKGIPVSNIGSAKLNDAVERYIGYINDRDNVVSVQDNRIKEGGPASLFKTDRMFIWFTNLQRMNAARSFEVDFGMVPLPKYDENCDYIAPLGGYWDSWLMVPVTNTDLDRCGVMLEALGYYSQQLVTPAFIETSVTTKTLRDDESAEMLELLLSKRCCDAGMYFDWGYNIVLNAAVARTEGFASVAASNKTVIDGAIASFMEAFE